MTRLSQIKRAFNNSLSKWRAITDIPPEEEEELRKIFFKVQSFNIKILINPYVSVSHPLRVMPIKRDDLEGFQRLRDYFEAVVVNAPVVANASVVSNNFHIFEDSQYIEPNSGVERARVEIQIILALLLLL
jgi:hypothetical protein